jgi:hypothetical protein
VLTAVGHPKQNPSNEVMKRLVPIAWAFAIGGLVVLFFMIVGRPLGNIFLGMRRVRKIEAAMQDTKIYEPVGRKLALYCQSDPSLFPRGADESWLPSELQDIGLGVGWMIVEPKHAQVEMGGGFHHFGYMLEFDAAKSTPETHVWQLMMSIENQQDRHLCSVALPANAQVTREELRQQLLASLNAQIRQHPGSPQAYQKTIATLLRFDHVPEARQACKEMLKTMPDDWWAVLVNALIASDQESPERGAQLINDWVAKNENFFRYLDLAYFYDLTQRPHDAAQAMVNSTKYDADLHWGEDGNSEFRGYTAAMSAYRAGEYEACLKLCDHLLLVTVNGDYAKQGLRDLKAAAGKALHGQVDEVPWAQGIRTFDAFEHLDIEKLLGRKLPRPTQSP